jgi:hypothetical protein
VRGRAPRAGPGCRARGAGGAHRPHLTAGAGARGVPRTGTTAHPRQDRAPAPGAVRPVICLFRDPLQPPAARFPAAGFPPGSGSG